MLISKNKGIGIFTFIWPFGGLLYSIFYWKNSNIKNIIWLFCVFFGAVFIYNTGSADSVRYAKYFENAAVLSFQNIISSFYEKKGIIDLYVPLVSYFISLFTANVQILFTFYAFVFGFFYSRNICYLIDKIEKKNNIYIGILLIFYILINPIWNINIVRFFTATHIFVYGAMPYIFEKKKSMLLWIFLSVLVHWSFVFAVMIFFIWKFLPKRINLFFIFYVSTLFINTINLKLIDVKKFGVIGQRISLYANNDAVQKYGSNLEKLSWHVTLSNEITEWAIQLYIIILYFIIKKRFSNNESFINLYTFSLFIYSFSNLMNSINFPEAYRFVDLSLLFVLPTIILTISYIHDKSLKINLFLLSIPIIFTILFIVRIGMDFYGLNLLFGNFISVGFIKDSNNFITIIKNLF